MRSGLARAIGRAAFAIALATASGAVVLAPVVARADEPTATNDVHAARASLNAIYVEMRTTSVRVRDQLRVVRRRGTRSQVLCVDEALSRADVALRHARTLGDELLEAYARGDLASARSTRGQIEELRSLTRFASMQATKCTPAGASASAINLPRTNTVTVKVDVDPNIARVD
jgi:hypothetical protein